jgi:hypothetical protein
MMLALTHSSLSGSLLEQAGTNRPEDHKVGIDFCKASNQLFLDLCNIKVNNTSDNNTLKNALQNSKNFLQTYINKYDPMLVFAKLATFISTYAI